MKTDTTITEKIDGSFFPGKSYNDKGEKVYSSAPSSKEISVFSNLNLKPLIQEGKDYTPNKRGNIEFSVGEYIIEVPILMVKNISTPTIKYLFRYFCNKYAENKTRQQEFSGEEYFKLRNLKDTPDNRKAINDQLIILSSFSYYTRSKKSGDMLPPVTFINDAFFRNFIFKFSFGDNYIQYVLSKASCTPYFPNILFSLDSRYDYNAFYIGEKMSIHKAQNTGKTNENRITVEKLLPVTDLPTEERVKDIKSRNTKQRISIPFINALETLNKLGGLNSTFKIKIETPEKKVLFYDGKSWNYGLKNIAIKEYNKDKLYDYQQLKDYMIIFDIVGYPELKPSVERQKKGKAIAYQQTKKKK